MTETKAGRIDGDGNLLQDLEKNRWLALVGPDAPCDRDYHCGASKFYGDVLMCTALVFVKPSLWNTFLGVELIILKCSDFHAALTICSEFPCNMVCIVVGDVWSCSNCAQENLQEPKDALSIDSRKKFGENYIHITKSW
ncbi:hypothetical protein STEG23_015297, partial [Scotinomys teguina]